MCNIYNIISILYSRHVCSARNIGTIKGEKLKREEAVLALSTGLGEEEKNRQMW